MSQPARPQRSRGDHQTVQSLAYRIQTHAALDVLPHVGALVGKPFSTPVGFNFRCVAPEQLVAKLSANRRFAKVVAPMDRLRDFFRPGRIVFREVWQPDSVHVIIDANANGISVLHLDSVSIVAGRDSAGQVTYVEDVATLFRHIKCDLIH